MRVEARERGMSSTSGRWHTSCPDGGRAFEEGEGDESFDARRWLMISVKLKLPSIKRHTERCFK